MTRTEESRRAPRASGASRALESGGRLTGATTRRVRWTCPNGCPAVLGSSRPRRDATVRFCLACSASSDRLVPRTAPVLEARRAAKQDRSRTKREQERARTVAEEDAYYTVHGVDLRAELRKLWFCTYATETRSRIKAIPKELPTLAIRTRTKPARTFGTASNAQHKILINRIPGQDAARVMDTLAHEVAHLLAPFTQHGIAWKTAFRSLCEEVYGVRPRVEKAFTTELENALREPVVDPVASEP